MVLETTILNANDQINICGPHNHYLEIIEEQFNTQISFRGMNIMIDNESSKEDLEGIFSFLKEISIHGIKLNERDVIYVAKLGKQGRLKEAEDVFLNRKSIINNHQGRPIFPVTSSQKKYLKTLENNDLVFGIGPAGTGKTYLAVLYAISLLKENKVKKIILTRPAVEAGESLGFLPGDLKEKVDPYLTPLYDALYEILGSESVEGLMNKGIIEIAPLAYMRGRTLSESAVILDEAQNTTSRQMKMFLTRLGFSSKMIVTGDITQIDLPNGSKSGLVEATRLLAHQSGIGIVEFETIDVVRHPLVQKILDCYLGQNK